MRRPPERMARPPPRRSDTLLPTFRSHGCPRFRGGGDTEQLKVQHISEDAISRVGYVAVISATGDPARRRFFLLRLPFHLVLSNARGHYGRHRQACPSASVH